MADKHIKREEIKSVRKRLKEQAPEVMYKRDINYNYARERRRRTLAANAQALHDSYVSSLQANPMLSGLRQVNVNHHKAQLRGLLTNMNAFQDPQYGLPAY